MIFQTSSIGFNSWKFNIPIKDAKSISIYARQCSLYYPESAKHTLGISGTPVFECPGDSLDLTLHDLKYHDDELRENSKNLLYESSNSLWYSVPRKQIMKLYDDVPTRVLTEFKTSGDSAVL